MAEQRIRVLIADDHPVVRQGTRVLLETDETIEVVSEAADGLEAVDKTRECQPDVVLMDIVMPGLDGLEATRRIKEQQPSTSVIMLTIYADKAFVIDAIQCGAGGYLLKDASRDLLCHTVRAVNSGGMLIKTSLLREAIGTLLDSAGRCQQESARSPFVVGEFTSREGEVLKLLVEGQTNKEIGKRLGIAEETAKKHVQNIIGKLAASDRTQAAVKAVRMGLTN